MYKDEFVFPISSGGSVTYYKTDAPISVLARVREVMHELTDFIEYIEGYGYYIQEYYSGFTIMFDS
ncbi:hypothetical protein BXO87_01900 [Bacillus sp. GZB]|nr:hypothetical protein BXO87_01900 [Bacillus sp. GZB]